MSGIESRRARADWSGRRPPRNSRLPRFMSGRTRCFCISFSLTARTASMSGATASRSSSGTPNSFEAEMAISRAVARFDRHQVGDQTDALFLGLGNSILHGGLVQQAVLDQPLGEAAQGDSTGAADRRYCVIIHGLKEIPATEIDKFTACSQAINCQIPGDTRTLRVPAGVTSFPLSSEWPRGSLVAAPLARMQASQAIKFHEWQDVGRYWGDTVVAPARTRGDGAARAPRTCRTATIRRCWHWCREPTTECRSAILALA